MLYSSSKYMNFPSFSSKVFLKSTYFSFSIIRPSASTFARQNPKVVIVEPLIYWSQLWHLFLNFAWPMLKFPYSLRTQLTEPQFFDAHLLFSHFPFRFRPGDTRIYFLFSSAGPSYSSFCFFMSVKLNSAHSLTNSSSQSVSFSIDFSGLIGALGSYRISGVGSSLQSGFFLDIAWVILILINKYI